MSVLTDKIKDEISQVVEDLGCRVVQVSLSNLEKSKTLQIMIEKLDETNINISDCENVSRAVSVKLDVLDPIKGNYNLEVSSTGINRPLVTKEDFIRFCKKPVVVKTYVLKNDRKIFKGILESASENGIKLILDTPLPNGDCLIELIYDEISSSYVDGLKFCNL